MRRILIVSLLFSMVCGLWGVPTARAATEFQLCGFANGLADSLIVTGLDPEGGPFVAVTGWVQFVPTIYTLRGSGAFSREIDDANLFGGGLVVVNRSDGFLNNPICAVSPTIQQLPNQHIFTGSAELLCVAGGSGPFMVTIQFALVPCSDPGPFVAQSQEGTMSALQGVIERSTLPAGYAPNEYRP